MSPQWEWSDDDLEDDEFPDDDQAEQGERLHAEGCLNLIGDSRRMLSGQFHRYFRNQLSPRLIK